MSTQRQVNWLRSASAAGMLLLTSACSQIGVDPDEPASIELAPFSAPAVVIGDTLRDTDGVATPVRAIVRNIRGEIIDDAAVQYIYAEFNRDSALTVDPQTGFVIARKQPTGEARIAARIGGALQVLRTLQVTERPDSIDRVGQGDIPALRVTLPDTSRASATANTSAPLSVVVRHRNTDGTTSAVRGWFVQFVIVQPTNAANDTTQAVFLVDDQGRPSVVDTTDTQGLASRRVRVRAAVFPPTLEPDSVVVEARARYRGTLLSGAPIRMVLPVNRGTTGSGGGAER